MRPIYLVDESGEVIRATCVSGDVLFTCELSEDFFVLLGCEPDVLTRQ